MYVAPESQAKSSPYPRSSTESSPSALDFRCFSPPRLPCLVPTVLSTQQADRKPFPQESSSSGGPYKVLVQWTQESLRHWEPSPPVFLAQTTLPLALATLSSLGLK